MSTRGLPQVWLDGNTIAVLQSQTSVREEQASFFRRRWYLINQKASAPYFKVIGWPTATKKLIIAG